MNDAMIISMPCHDDHFMLDIIISFFSFPDGQEVFIPRTRFIFATLTANS